MLKNILVLLHVISAASWFGLALVIGRIARGAVDDSGQALREVGSKVVAMMTASISLAFVFGFIAFLIGGGFGVYGPQFHASIGLVLLLVLIQIFMIRPAWTSLAKGGSALDSARKRVSMGTGIGHLIWLIVLILMFWTHFPIIVTT